MKPTLVALCGILLTTFCFGQSCLPEGIVFQTQSQVDSFPILYPDCTEILGDVTIESPQITSFSSLESITHIRGHLKIEDTAVPGLSGFTSLLFVDKLTIRYHDTTTIQNISGFDNLEIVESDLNVSNNGSLRNVSIGFGALEYIGGTLLFGNNMGLTRIDGFNKLEEIGGNLTIGEFVAINDINGFDNLRKIDGQFVLAGTNLNMVSGFNSLDTIRSVRLGYNDQMTSLEWLEDVSYIGPGALSLEYNFNLSFCATEAVCEHLRSNSFPNQVMNNFEGCNSVEEVLEACILSTGEETASSSFYVFPNPAADRVKLIVNSPEMDHQYEWYLLDARGNILQEDLQLNNSYLDLSAFPNGLYILILRERTSGKLLGSKKVVLNH